MIFSDIAVITGSAGRTDRVRFLTLTALSTVLQAVAVVTLIPLLRALFGDRPADAWPWAGLLIGELVVAWAADMVATRAGLRLGFGIIDAVERCGLSAIRRLDPAELHSARASRLRDLVATAGPESTSVMVLLGSPLIHAALLTPLLALLLLTVSWKLTLVALAGGVLMLGALTASRKAVAKSELEFAEANRELNDRTLEFAWAQPTLRGAGAGLTTLDGVLAASRSRGLKLLAWQIPGDTVFSIVLQLVLLAFGFTSGALYLAGDLDGVSAAVMVVVLLRIVETTGSLSLLSTPLAAARRTLHDVRELVELDKAAGGDTGHGAPTPATPAMTVDSVGYVYPDGTRALDDVGLEIPAGQITVIVGGSGSGKSTLLDVLAGLREPTTGEVRVDSEATDAAGRLRGTSLVFQSTELRPGTLKQNVVVSDESRDDLTAIADLARLSELLETLPSGWDTRVGEAANALSGGERQRVGLARALAKPAGLLLVDEATSALDAITERAVVEALDRIRGSRTTVIVTHRPALVALADQVVVLDGGRVADSGELDDLLSRGGVFADLWRRWRESEGWQV